MPEAALDNWQPVWNAQVSISTLVCVNFEHTHIVKYGSHFVWGLNDLSTQYVKVTIFYN